MALLAAISATTARGRRTWRAMLWRVLCTRPRWCWRSYMSRCQRMAVVWGGVEYPGEKLHDAPFRIVERAPRRSHHEADVPAVGHELQRQCRSRCGDRAHFPQYCGRQKRIVRGAEQQRGDADPRQESDCARSLVIVIGAPESVNRRGHRIIELVDRARPGKPDGIREIGVLLELRECLAFERTQEARLVHPGESLSDVARATREIEWDGHRGGAPHLGGKIDAALAEPFEQHVAAEREAGEDQRRAGMLARQMLDDERQVTRLAGVVKAARAIEGAGARPEIEQVRTPSTPLRFRERPSRVPGLGRSFESVEHDQPRRVG